MPLLFFRCVAYSPVQVMEDVVAVRAGSPGAIAQSTDGLLFSIRFRSGSASESEPVRIYPFAILDFHQHAGNNSPSRNSMYYINGDNALVNTRRSGRIELAQDVQSVWRLRCHIAGSHLMIIKNDNSLWGFGSNSRGHLGDGTTVPRQEAPVQIAENVISAGNRHFITAEGVLWIWDRHDPTPAPALDNVATVIATRGSDGFNGTILLKDGTLITDFERWSRAADDARRERYTHGGVKLPQSIVFG